MKKYTDEYLKNGLLHRANGPAYHYSSTAWWGAEEWCWYLDGYPHRYYGPCDHMGEWYIKNTFIK